MKAAECIIATCMLSFVSLLIWGML